jgi:hypothetical protein
VIEWQGEQEREYIKKERPQEKVINAGVVLTI